MTMTNLEWIAKNDIRAGDAIRRTEFGNWMVKNHFGEDVNYWFVKWLDMEHKEPILDDAEKRYLSAVIRPFRNDVQYIVKYGGRFSSRAYEEIAVRYQDKMIGIKCCFLLPKFDKDTMYKGMELNRHYTPKELGL